MRGNFVDLPTDCPQRDERLGWTGDIQVFAPDRHLPLRQRPGLLTEWLADSRAEQCRTAPSRTSSPRGSTALPVEPRRRLGDAGSSCRGRCTSAPATGDPRAQLPSMRGVGRQVVGLAGPDRTLERRIPVRRLAGPGGSAGATRPGQGGPGVVATAHSRARHGSSRRPPRLLGRASRPEYADLARSVRSRVRARVRHAVRTRLLGRADRRTRWRSSGICCLRPTSVKRPGAAASSSGRRVPDRDRLRRDPAGLRRAERQRYVDVAYRCCCRPECPSWLYPVTMGATTIWERWDSLLPDGSVNRGGMTSFNHYALGAVADWLHRTRRRARARPRRATEPSTSTHGHTTT